MADDDGYPFRIVPGGSDVLEAVPEGGVGETTSGAAADAASSAGAPRPASIARPACCANCAAGQPCAGPAPGARLGVLTGGVVGDLLDSLAERPGVCALAGAALAWHLTGDQSKRMTHALYGLVGGYVLAGALRRQR